MDSRRRHARSHLRRDLVAFVGTGLLVVVAISFGAVVFIQQVAQSQALSEDERITQRLASVVAQPLDDLLAGDVESRHDLDQLVETRLRDGTIAKIDVWAPDGQILFSGDAATTGRRFPLPDEAREAIEHAVTTSDLESHPETGPAAEPIEAEVYVPLVVHDRVLAFEAYFSLRTVRSQVSALTTKIVPPTLAALLVLQVFQVLIAVSLARRVRRHEAERSELLEEALAASERERREIAARLHDGVVQDLSGIGYVLGALSLSVPPERRALTDRVDTTIRGSVEALRQLVVDVYPPDLSGSGLADAITGLAEPLVAAGLVVRLDLRPPALDPDVAMAVYRTARESLANITKHARARTVGVQLAADDDPRWAGRDAVLLRIADDGVGPPDRGWDRRAEGHFGLTLLGDRIAELGGELTVGPGAAGGTVSHARLPARAHSGRNDHRAGRRLHGAPPQP